MSERIYVNRTEKVFLKKLHSELLEVIPRIEGVSDVVNGRVGIDFPEEQPSTTQEIVDAQTVVDAHDPTDYEQQQVNAVASNMAQIFKGLRQLNPEDAAYAAYGRSWAANNGENQATINAIVDRATAGQYITTQSEWSNLPASSKQFMIAHIDAEMKLFQAIIKMLT